MRCDWSRRSSPANTAIASRKVFVPPKPRRIEASSRLTATGLMRGDVEDALAHRLVIRQVDRALVIDLFGAPDELERDRVLAGEALARVAEEFLPHAERQVMSRMPGRCTPMSRMSSSCAQVLCRPKAAKSARRPPASAQRTIARV
jgi:hypothetical protein